MFVRFLGPLIALLPMSLSADEFFLPNRKIERDGAEYVVLEAGELDSETLYSEGSRYFHQSKYEAKRIALLMRIGTYCPDPTGFASPKYLDGWGVPSYEKSFVGRNLIIARPLPAEFFSRPWRLFLNEGTDLDSLTAAGTECREYFDKLGSVDVDPIYVVFGKLNQTPLSNGKYSKHWIELDSVQFSNRVMPSTSLPNISLFDLLSLVPVNP